MGGGQKLGEEGRIQRGRFLFGSLLCEEGEE